MEQKGQKQIAIIDKYCIEVTETPHSLIFFKKLQADIYRYLAENNPTLYHFAEEKYKEALYI
jgi:hypothetical protein